MRIGFVGLGIMGRPMADHLLAAGHELLVIQHRTPISARLRDGGARICGSAQELAAAAEVVILMLPDTPDVEKVLFGPAGIAAGLRPGATLIDMSSISPIATREFAGRIAQLGCAYLDAPVSGGQAGAVAASLSIMVGGEPDVFERMQPLFAAMGRNISLVGPCGAGQTAKVANQVIVALTIEAVAEGLLLASKAGVDPAKVRAALLGGFASSRVLEVHGERMIARKFDAGFRIQLHHKDLNLALETAHALGMPLPNTAATQSLFAECMACGGQDWDHSALVKILEARADHEMA